MTRRKHTRVAWVVRRHYSVGFDREFDTREKARRYRAIERAHGISGYVARVVLRRARR